MKNTSVPILNRAAIYARQSLSLADGIERQVERCRKLCQDRGWDVVRVYEDNEVSASKARAKGTAWATMLEDISRGGFDVVVAVDVDRLLRQVVDLTLLTETGIRVLTVDGEIDLTTADGQFRATMLASIAQFETRRKSERQLRANEARSAAGRPVPTRRRYGYETDGCTPREQEAKEVRRLFQEFREGASLRSLALDMRDREVSPGGGRGWPLNRVRWILNSPFYGGQTLHLGQVSDSPYIVPIVSKEAALEVRAILADPSRRTSPGNTVRHELSGLIKCGVCDAHLSFMNSYLCSKATNHVSIRKDKIEPLVMWRVHQWITDMDVPESPKPTSKIMQSLLLESARISSEISQRQEMVFWEGANKSELKSIIQALGSKRLELERAIDSQRSTSALNDIIDQVRAKWEEPIDPSNFEDWQEAMISISLTSGTVLEASDFSFEQFELKSRVEKEIGEWPAFWGSLSLDVRREVIRSLFRVVVNKGRTYERIEITVIDTDQGSPILEL